MFKQLAHKVATVFQTVHVARVMKSSKRRGATWQNRHIYFE